MRKFLVSALMGSVALLLVNLTSFISGVSLCVNVFTLLISTVLGISGVITMLILGYIM